jgi:hypothetical protein
MFRILAIVATLALAVPTLALAQGNNEEHHKPGTGGKPPGPGGAKSLAPHGPGTPPGPPHGPMAGPHPGMPGPMAGPHSGGPPGAMAGPPGGRHFSFRGHEFNGIHGAPFIYPHGWAYRRWAAGGVLPPLFLTPGYFYPGWASMGLEAPPPGYQWVRYGPDLLLVDVNTGEIADVAYGVFY